MPVGDWRDGDVVAACCAATCNVLEDVGGFQEAMNKLKVTPLSCLRFLIV